jgi:hypothetical protein
LLPKWPRLSYDLANLVLDDEGLRPRIKDLTDHLGMAMHISIAASAELNESISGIAVANEQASKILPSRKLKLSIQCAAKDRSQHIS